MLANESVQNNRGAYVRTTHGKGDDEDIGTSLGYVEGIYDVTVQAAKDVMTESVASLKDQMSERL